MWQKDNKNATIGYVYLPKQGIRLKMQYIQNKFLFASIQLELLAKMRKNLYFGFYCGFIRYASIRRQSINTFFCCSFYLLLNFFLFIGVSIDYLFVCLIFQLQRLWSEKMCCLRRPIYFKSLITKNKFSIRPTNSVD